MAQINTTVGATAVNAEKVIDIIKKNQMHHDVIIFPELALTGYPPEDLLFRKKLFHQVDVALNLIQSNTLDCHVIIGHPSLEGSVIFNSASIFANGQRIALYHKQHLPNYGVFDEQRYFMKGDNTPCLFSIKGYQVGLCICEDLWQPGPVEQILEANADILFCLNASPFDEHKPSHREALLRNYAKQGIIIIYVNQVGGQDELVFDGQSLAFDATGQLCARSLAFEEHLNTVILKDHLLLGDIRTPLSREALMYKALVCGLNNYIEKNKFSGVLLGLSGGIDSALTLCIAVDALGASRVHAVMLPSRYTAAMSEEDAKQQAEALQVQYSTLPIEPAFQTLLTTLSPAFVGYPKDTTEENLQARIRAVLLMALSNKTGYLLLTTSNKSETAVGYTTLYGDMAGGFAVLKDVLKTSVYALAHYRNNLSPVIPSRVLTRPPSAELAPNQTDQDTLPKYDVLDAIISFYMDDNLDADAIIQKGFAADEVLSVLNRIQQNEYKRRQAPPGIKVTTRAFGRDWRYPITSGFITKE
jgi:NAD+ synthase (glutamine-hydrolysing)